MSYDEHLISMAGGDGETHMSDMAGVILAHSSWSYELDYDGMGTNGIWCDMCGEGEDFPGDPEDGWMAKHQAAMLAAAGFGLVREVTDRVGKRYAALHQKLRDELRAQAWEEGFQDGHRQDAEGDDGPRFTNPYRSAR